jgi:hypothetical protein
MREALDSMADATSHACRVGLVAKAPWELPEFSERVALARQYVYRCLDDITDISLRAMVSDMLSSVNEPGKMLLEQCEPPTALWTYSIQKMRQVLPYDPTWAAPGAGATSHHCYPGGWAIHTALNLRTCQSLISDIRLSKNVKLNVDAILAAMILHDWAKLKLLVWNSDHSLDDDQGIGHHVIALAECMLRDFPPRVVGLLAGVHSGWWSNPDAVEKDMRKATEIVGMSVAEAYLSDQGLQDSVEGWVVRQAERCWYDPSRRCVTVIDDKLRAYLARQGRAPKSFVRVRNVVYTIFDEMQLMQILSVEGEAALEKLLDKWLDTDGA